MAAAQGGGPHDATLGATLDQGAELIVRAKDLSVASAPSAPTLPGYVLTTRLGIGTFGEAWAGVQSSTGQKVAVKIFTRYQSLDWHTFRSEVDRLIDVSEHPNVVTLLDANLEHVPPFFVMPLLGSSLAETQGSVEQIADWLKQVLQGLSYIHARGILHGDLKPANVLLDHLGQARLADFGQSFVTQAGGYNLGTMGYMPPEQIQRALGYSQAVAHEGWDIYALGATAYRLLSGQTPRLDERTRLSMGTTSLADRLQACLDIAQAPLVPLRRLNPKVDPELAAIVENCLEDLTPLRYGDAESVLQDLQRRQDGLPLQCRRPWSAFYRLRSFQRRNQASVNYFLLILLVLIISLLSGWRQVGKEREIAQQQAKQLETAEEGRKSSLAEQEKERAQRSALEISLGTMAADQGKGDEALLWWAQALRDQPSLTGFPFLLDCFPLRLALYNAPQRVLSGLILPQGSDNLAVVAPQNDLELYRPDGKRHKIGRLLGPHVLALKGKLLASGGDWPKIRQFDLATGQRSNDIWLFPPAAMTRFWNDPSALMLSCLSYSPDGQRLLAGCGNGFTILLDSVNGRRLSALRLPGAAVEANFSADGRFVALLTEAGALRVYSCPQLNPLPPTYSGILQARLSADGQILAVIDEHGAARTVHVSSGATIKQLGKARLIEFSGNVAVTDNWVEGARSFSADGSHLVTVRGNKVQVFDSLSHKPTTPPLVHSDKVQLVTLSPDGGELATYDGWLRLFRAQGPSSQVDRYKAEDFSLNDESLLVVEGGMARRIGLKEGKEVGPPLGPGQQFSFGGPDQVLYLQNHLPRLADATGAVRSDTNQADFLLSTPSGAVAASSHSYGYLGKPFSSSREPILGLAHLDSHIVLLHPSGLSIEGRRQAGIAGRFTSLLQSKQNLLAIRESSLAIIGSRTDPKGHFSAAVVGDIHNDYPITASACDPEGNFVILGGANGHSQVWKISSGAALSRPFGGNGKVTAVALSRDAHFAASADDSGQVSLWLLPEAVPLPLPTNIRLGAGKCRRLRFGSDDSLWILREANPGTSGSLIRVHHPNKELNAANVVRMAERTTGRRLEGALPRCLTPAEWAQP